MKNNKILQAVVAVCALLFAAACSDAQPGSGIGRLPSPAVIEPVDIGIGISELAFGPVGQGAAYVELSALEPLEKAPAETISLCSFFACIELTPSAQQSLVDDGFVELDAPAIENLKLVAQAGELALFAAGSALIDYLAWGAEPLQWGSTWSTEAYATGVFDLENRLPLPFPPPATFSIVQLNGIVSCADSSPDRAASHDDRNRGLCPAKTASGLKLLEIFPGSSTKAGYVAIKNTTPAPLNTFGLQVCNTSQCLSVETATTIAAGQSVTLSLRPVGETAALLRANTHVAALRVELAADEVALFAPSIRRGEQALLDYVAYGDATLSLNYLEMALNRNLWTDSDGRAAALGNDSQALQRVDENISGPDAWALGQPSY